MVQEIQKSQEKRVWTSIAHVVVVDAKLKNKNPADLDN